MSKCKFSVVVPVYNTTHVLIELVEQICNMFNELNESEFEIILVNDYSPNPETKVYLTKACLLDQRVKVIHFGRNFGQQPATICGISQSKGEFVITMDDDLQHSPEDIKNLIKEREHDIVIAHLKGKKHSFFKRVASNIKNHFDHIILGKPKHIKMSSFRLISRFVADNICKLKSPNPFIPAMLFMISKDVVNVSVDHHQRAEGETGYNLKSMIRLFSNLMINNSSFLLNFLGKLGIITALSSSAYAFYLIYRKLVIGVDSEGWTSLMVAILFIGGLLLFSIGIIGEYLIRVIQSSEQKPAYIVKSIEGQNE